LLNLVWDKLLPAMKSDALPADAENAARLQTAMKSLVLPYPSGDAKSKAAASISGRRFQFAENAQGLDTLSIETSGPEGQVTLVSRSKGKEQRLVCGHKQWMKGRFAWGPQAEQPVAASGAWVDDETFTARIYYVETPFSLTLRMKFADQELTLDTEANVGFGPTVRPQLKGKDSQTTK